MVTSSWPSWSVCPAGRNTRSRPRRPGPGPTRGGRQEEDEEEQEQACCSQVQAEKTGPDRRPAGGGGQVGDEEQESGGGGGQPQGGEGGAAVCPGGTQTVLHSPDKGGAGRISEPVSSPGAGQAPKTCLPLPRPGHRQEHRGGPHRHAEQRHPKLQHPAGGQDGADPHQHPHADQSLGHGQDQLQPQHPQLLLPAEEPHRGGPAQSQHPGTPLTVTSAQYASYTANIFYKDCPRIILSLSSLVAEKVYMYKIYVFIIKKK